MQYNLKGTNIDLSEELRAYIDKKLSGMDVLLANDEAARVDIELEYKESEEKMYRAELMLHDGTVLRAEARGSSLHEAIDKAVDELFAELTKAKKKQRAVFRHSAVKVKEYLRGWRNKI